MFDIGTRVVMVSSTFKKPTGPRRGSVGYMSNPGNSAVLRSLNLMAVSTEMVFARYGFEKNRRYEKRKVILVLPSIGKNSDGDICDQVDKTVDLINSPDRKEHASIRAAFGYNSSIPIAVATQHVGNSTLMDCQDKEFKAWVDSILCSHSIQMYITSVTRDKHFTKSHDKRLVKELSWTIIRDMMVRQVAARVTVNNWLQTKDTRKSAIEFIRLFQSMDCKNNRETIASTVYHKLSMHEAGENLKWYHVYDAIGHFALTTIMPGVLIAMAKTMNSKYLSSHMEDLEEIKARLRVLSYSLEMTHTASK